MAGVGQAVTRQEELVVGECSWGNARFVLLGCSCRGRRESGLDAVRLAGSNDGDWKMELGSLGLERWVPRLAWSGGEGEASGCLVMFVNRGEHWLHLIDEG